jgi:hypothetical protein
MYGVGWGALIVAGTIFLLTFFLKRGFFLVEFIRIRR